MFLMNNSSSSGNSKCFKSLAFSFTYSIRSYLSFNQRGFKTILTTCIASRVLQWLPVSPSSFLQQYSLAGLEISRACARRFGLLICGNFSIYYTLPLSHHNRPITQTHPSLHHEFYTQHHIFSHSVHLIHLNQLYEYFWYTPYHFYQTEDQ